MKKFVLVLSLAMIACHTRPDDADKKQRVQQEQLLAEATSQTGMPNIKNFRERKMLKDILELRDQTGVITYTYLVSDYQGALVFFCDSVGYGIPYATQYTNPQKPVYFNEGGGGNITLPQADPNALFSPAAAEGTWVMCKDPNGDDVKVVYVEPRIVVSPFPLDKRQAALSQPAEH